MTKMLKFAGISGSVFILLMILLNPSYTDFKQFVGDNLYGKEYIHRAHNYLIYSIYEEDTMAYLAICKNFY